MAWSAASLAAGVMPSRRHDGSPFAGDSHRAARAGQPLALRAAFLQIRGDWSQLKTSLGLVGWSGEGPSKRICWQCLAGFPEAGAPDWRDPSAQAPWRCTALSHIDFLEDTAVRGAALSKLFGIPGMLLEYVEVDLMHAGDLGILQYVLGNVLFECFGELGGVLARPDQTLGELLQLLKTFSRELGQAQPPLNGLTLPMIRKVGKPPKLKAKASETRRALPCVLRLLEVLPVDTPHRHLRYHCLRWAGPL